VPAAIVGVKARAMEAGRGRMVTLALRRDRCAIAKEDAAAFKEHIVSSAVPGQGSGKPTTSHGV